MQTVVHVITTSRSSLRDRIVSDVNRLADYSLELAKEHQRGRPRGWAKLHSTRDGSGFGALNLSWDASTRTLVGRVVNRGKGRPGDIVGDFCAYLLRSRFHSKITLIQVFQTKT